MKTDGASRILVVEDEEALADSVRYNLEREGYAVSVAGTTLTLAGRRPSGDVVARQFLRLERGQGEFRRAFSFPDAIDAGRIAADFSDGLLTVTVPKAAHAAARRIDIG